MTTHELKILPRYYSDVVRFAKRFEARRNDRNFQPGDRVRLREWDGTYTGREAEIEITYVLTDKDFPEAIKEGYCIFGFWLMAVEGVRD